VPRAPPRGLARKRCRDEGFAAGAARAARRAWPRVHGRGVNARSRGWLVAFEGLDGSGKSTQVEALARALSAAGRDVLATHEPSDGPTGARIREMARAGRLLPPEEELRWFVEDRRAHVRDEVAPALAAGRVVVTDRYFLSTAAYQGARGLDWRAILAASEAEFPLPDLVLLLEIDPRRGLERVRARGAALEGAFEREERLRRVAEIFAAIDRPWIERIGAEGSPDAVHAAILARVRARLPGLLGSLP
jgi:dTMP kinase